MKYEWINLPKHFLGMAIEGSEGYILKWLDEMLEDGYVLVGAFPTYTKWLFRKI